MPDRNWLGGICAGLAYFIGIEVWIVRIFWMLFLSGSDGFAVVVYLLLFVVSKWNTVPPDFDEMTGD